MKRVVVLMFVSVGAMRILPEDDDIASIAE
jgi:hypothetical protein